MSSEEPKCGICNSLLSGRYHHHSGQCASKACKKVTNACQKHSPGILKWRQEKEKAKTAIDLHHLEHLVEHRPEFPLARPISYTSWSLILHKHVMGVQFDVTAM